jgi:large subunit ribosomal protein L15
VVKHGKKSLEAQMLQLDKLTSLVKKRKRVGRGGKRGGTSGKGHKGQKARSGPKIDPGFEGGQMPLYRRLPKRGFNNTQFQVSVGIVNIGTLNDLFESDDVVSKEMLIAKKLIKPPKGKGAFLLKILGRGDLVKKISVEADLFSKSAREAIEKAGGEVRLLGKTK